MALVILLTIWSVFVAGATFAVVALVDAVRRPATAWEAASRSKLRWVLALVFVPVPFALVYWLDVRKRFEPA